MVSLAENLNTPTITEWAGVILGSGPWQLFAIDQRGDRHTVTVTADTITTETAKLADTSDVWVSMATLATRPAPGRRGTAEQMASIRSLWVDIDIAGAGHANTDLPGTLDDAETLLGTYPLPPTCVIHTGGGLHAYWALTADIGRADGAELLNKWGRHWTDAAAHLGWHLDAVFDITRVMRVPHTTNRKRGGTRPVTVHTWQPDRRYTAAILDTLLVEPTPTTTTINVREPGRLAPVVGYIGNDRPGDAFDQAHTCGEILARHGWQHHHTDRTTGNEHWTRPGKDVREGSSATVYVADGRCVIWTSALTEVAARDSLGPFRLYTKLDHGGDWTAAARTLAAEGYGTRTTTHLPAATLPATTATTGTTDGGLDEAGAMFIDWADFWARDHAAEEWLIRPLIPVGRSVSISAPGGTGKSFLSLYASAALATGRPCLGDTPPATDVLYLDFEMTESDLFERLEAFGYGADIDMSRLHYALLPAIDPLDTDTGAAMIVRLAQETASRLVVIDTFSRAVKGLENESSTVLDFYRLTGRALKAAGVALLRIDHTGKDLDKGARGTSAKRDDVDAAWLMTATETGVQLKATKRRVSWVPEVVIVDKVDTDDGLIWAIRSGATDAYPAGTAEVARLLDELGVEVGASRRKAQQIIREAGKGAKVSVIGAALRYRRQRPLGAVDNLPQSVDKPVEKVGNHLGNHLVGDASGTTGEPTGTTSHNRRSEHGNHSGNHWEPRELASGSRFPLSREGTGTSPDPEPDPDNWFGL